MNYEEKLKEALNGGTTNSEVVRWTERNFPELAESEDEKIRKEIVDFICWATDRGSITSEQRERSNSWLAWLEKQGEQKSVEWSEEDDEMLDSIIEEVRYIGDFPDYPTKEEDELYDECLAKVEWLKSLKDKYTWKPSDEQMDALRYVFKHYIPTPTDTLAWDALQTIELMLEQLKKLKE